MKITNKLLPYKGEIKKILLITASALGMILFTYFTPPAIDEIFFKSLPIFNKLSGDLPQYAGRFLFSFVFLGILPLFTALILKYKPADIGIKRTEVKNRKKFWLILIPTAIMFGILSSINKETAAFYPFSNSFPELINQYGVFILFIHPLCYFLFYYIPWEILFRGILVFPFINSKNIYSIACLQAIPSALLHFGHPISETISALFFGIAAGVLVIKTRSILPALVFHALVGIALDITLIISVL